jgi:Cu/Ag efflux protein CusF
MYVGVAAMVTDASVWQRALPPAPVARTCHRMRRFGVFFDTRFAPITSRSRGDGPEGFWMRKGLLAPLGLALASFVSLGTWAAEEGEHRAHGTVKAVDAAAGTVIIDHGDIPGLMMGMTMEFAVSDPEVLRGVAPGQMIHFSVRKDGNRYLVTEIRPTAAGKTPSRHEMMNGGCDCCGGRGMAPGAGTGQHSTTGAALLI